MRYLSVCSGIEASSVAWQPLDWTPVAFAEIEPFPCSVLSHHYPAVPNWGDITRYQDWPDEPVELFVGGTPCQSFSVAGLCSGLADPRGQLVFAYLGILDRYRPRWAVWENVPGVLSADGGRAFGTFVGALGQLGYGWAYRVLDAQYFGLAQRRQRVFVVGCLGGWQRAAAVLFDAPGLCWNPPPRREAGERVARPIASCPPGGSGYRNDADTADNLTAVCGPLTAGSLSVRGTETAESGHLLAHALLGEGHNASEDGTGRGTPLVPVAFQERFRGDDGRGYGRPPPVTEEIAGSLETVKPWNVATGMVVRRLTPRECERLQGFPDDWTLVPHRGKPAADGPRYKALGNSMAVPVVRWIGERIALVEGLA